ncbi:MAG TPA: family 1 encapsulin nanocompartment shell protein [Methanotrichaceae archaeon]|nr:family 1 encapsulin nanocompartment shell protein [Methanotrichaceae archaeon]
MENKYLTREDAPIGSDVWKELDNTMAEAAKGVLAGRRLLHIEGPYGLGLKAVPLQDNLPEGGLITSSFIPVSLIQKLFTLSKRDLAAFEREGFPINTSAVASAAIDAAKLEDSLIFNGAQEVPGLMNAPGSSEYKLSTWDAVGKAADEIIGAITLLDKAGFHGPYSMALAPARYNLLLRRYPQGGTELEHISTMVTDGIYKAPLLKSGGVLLASGRQYAAIVLGQDMAVGFIGPAGEMLEFSITESLAPVIREPKAVCVLK